MAGGTLWALTPLRQPIFGAGRTPDEGEAFFRGYNALIVVIALLLTVALVAVRREPRAVPGPTFRVGWWTILVGHVLVVAGSVLAVILGGSLREVVTLGQDAGFVGAMVAALGALPLGAAGYRRGALPRPAAVLFMAALPVGLLAMVVLDAVGAPEDVLGLPPDSALRGCLGRPRRSLDPGASAAVRMTRPVTILTPPPTPHPDAPPPARCCT